MNIQFDDILGEPLNVGDTVAVAFPAGRSSSVLRIGTILNFHEKIAPSHWDYITHTYVSSDPVQKVEVEWDQKRSGGYVPDKPTKMELWADRFIKLSK